ncbi:ankyrin [Schizopora paradoxa]|uniref:Ankyrin n=1 Tax=Schizopora paradoxa TaxID=27342 RepID=A0A0H2S8R1_9AGAM|nr:ankyrin [Schizopora paradoxa]
MSTETDTEGATPNERLLAAAKEDDVDMFAEVIEGEGKYDINHADGLGMTALHYAASRGSIDVIEHILSQDGCDVDPINRIAKATPLHLALELPDRELRKLIVESLLDAGADIRIKDKNNETPLTIASSLNDPELEKLMRKSQAQSSLDRDDVADEDDDEGDEGSGSESD